MIFWLEMHFILKVSISLDGLSFIGIRNVSHYGKVAFYNIMNLSLI